MADLKVIRQAYLEGWTISRIRKVFDVSGQVVRAACKGLRRRRPPVSPAQCRRIRQLALAGVSTRDIRRVTGHCAAVITRETKSARQMPSREQLEADNEALREENEALRAVLSSVS